MFELKILRQNVGLENRDESTAGSIPVRLFHFKSGGVMVAYKVHALVILVRFQASQLIIDQGN